MRESFFQFGYYQVGVTIEVFKVVDSVPAEKGTGYGPVEPIVGFFDRLVHLGYAWDHRLTSTFPLGEMSDVS